MTTLLPLLSYCYIATQNERWHSGWRVLVEETTLEPKLTNLSNILNPDASFGELLWNSGESTEMPEVDRWARGLTTKQSAVIRRGGSQRCNWWQRHWLEEIKARHRYSFTALINMTMTPPRLPISLPNISSLIIAAVHADFNFQSLTSLLDPLA